VVAAANLAFAVELYIKALLTEFQIKRQTWFSASPRVVPPRATPPAPERVGSPQAVAPSSHHAHVYVRVQGGNSVIL
jgi:hypothetical protein